MNCRCMPWPVRVARLREVEHLAGVVDSPPDANPLPVSGRIKRSAEEARGAPAGKKAKGSSGLTAKVDQMSAELNQIKDLLFALQPGACVQGPPVERMLAEEDALSITASATQFQGSARGEPFHTTGSASLGSARSSSQGSEEFSMGATVRGALARLQLDLPQEGPAPVSAFFRNQRAPATFSVPPSEDYLKELHACWRDSKAFSHSNSDSRALAAMQDAAKYGRGRMPAVEPAIASLIVAPEETLRQDARCPRPQCRVTDNLLSKAYDAGARMGRIGNSLSHLMLAVSASLQQGVPDASVGTFSDASLHAFALMTRELGRMMSTLVQAHRQVWLAQSPLTDTCRRVLRSVPVEPGEMFGPAALEALERTAQAGKTRQQLAGLKRHTPASSGPRTPTTAPRRRTRPSAGPSSYRQPAQQPVRSFRAPDGPPPRQSRGSGHGRRGHKY